MIAKMQLVHRQKLVYLRMPTSATVKSVREIVAKITIVVKAATVTTVLVDLIHVKVLAKMVQIVEKVVDVTLLLTSVCLVTL